ncbi:uncharacterized protein DUF4157 [Plasticicumulans lactativorans]|uniref:Uncharacterized protein DUF4157 n=1 Tax=Plasticicumulans lactativorans TaxID=1133106 RepID=A0A4R2L0W0_9GAMM|nr:DUF4157 domain-containing protein [Plasticicumulans lactativorans]TCO80661.1 uncharacterized protein DUF4157 [Plasticicumulans lactativorans]
MLAAHGHRGQGEAASGRAGAHAPSPPARNANPLWSGLALQLPAGIELGRADDPLERAADATAARVLRGAPASAPPAVDPARGVVRRRAGAAPAAPATATAGNGGQPLPTTLRGFFEPRFGADLSTVRVHTDAAAAAHSRALQARAFTLGEHVAFAPGAYAPHTSGGRELLAHELAHVLQQRAGTGARVQRQSIPEAAGLGTAATTAPIATLSPQQQMNEEIDRELVAIARARLLLPWIDAHFSFSLAELLADGTLMASLDLRRDRALRARIYPFPGNQPPAERAQVFTATATVDALLGPVTREHVLTALDLLRVHGAVIRIGQSEDFIASITRVEARLERDTFDAAATAIETFAAGFKARVNRLDPIEPVVATEVLPSAWAAGAQVERDEETAAIAARQRLEAQLATAPEGPQRERLAAQLEAAQRRERRAQGFHTFAAPVVRLLERLRTRNTAWTAGTYPRHFWAEFSVDIFLRANIDADGFWSRPAARQFFTDLNAACEEATPPGKFAWKAIYNDDTIRTETNARYGAGRVLSAPNHGPAPDHKLHIHLDLRPLTVSKDAVTGYDTATGHVQPNPPAP